MPHRLAGIDPLWYWVMGAGTWLSSKVVMFASGQGDPGSMTDVVGSGGVAVSASAVALSFIGLVRYLAAVYNENAKAARDERDRVRVAEQADKDRAEREALSVREHDARLAVAEARIEANKAEIAEANERARVAESKAAEVKVVIDGVRERRHADVIDQNRYMLGTGIQVMDNTEAFNQMRIGLIQVAKHLGIDVGIPAPIEPTLSGLPGPVAHVGPDDGGPTPAGGPP